MIDCQFLEFKHMLKVKCDEGSRGIRGENGEASDGRVGQKSQKPTQK